ncbi:MAG: relaxase/mobilization nuclease domain-containing protein [Lachnospiraceae bacterium]|nr:relaxase/mobilization nuclease domain-containing protein [Lachnospiraceae bacterium]
MAILKHIASKNADYTVAERYLVFQHDEETGKPILDEEGYLIQRENYLLEGINCNPHTFARECHKLNRTYGKNKNKNDIKTHHYILSFDPRDQELGLTVQKAQMLGMEFAKAHFPGHQMLVCTHEDGHNGSGNIHVHIVLNSLRMLDTGPLPYEMRSCDTKAGYKHNCTKALLAYLQNEVMNLCREHGLHQVDMTGSLKRVTDAEYHAAQRGQRKADAEGTRFQTEKEKIRQAIASTMKQSVNLEEFKQKLLDVYGIQVKESRGRYSYLPPGRKKAISGKKLGDAFIKEAVAATIFGTGSITFAHDEQKLEMSEANENQMPSFPSVSVLEGSQSIGRMVDIAHNQKVQSSKGYERWAKIHNLQEQAKTFNFLVERGLLESDKLDEGTALLTAAYRRSKSELKATEEQLRSVNRTLRLIGQYYSTKQVYRIWLNGKKQTDFYEEHRSEISLHEAASKELRELFGEQKLPSVTSLKEEKTRLSALKDKQYQEYCSLRSQRAELQKLIQNRNSFITHETQSQKEEKHPTGID